MTYQFTFLRHGESTGNRNGYIQGQHDFPLTPNGVEQARTLAEEWYANGITFDRIISSPLQRALSTAETIRSVLGTSIQTDPLWMERNWGMAQGLSREVFNRDHPRPRFIQLYDTLGENGESEWQLFLRAGKAVQSLFHNPPGTYLIISHGGILNKVLHAIFGIKIQADFQGLQFELNHTGYTRVAYDWDRNQWQLLDYVQPDKKSNNQRRSRKEYRITFIRHGESQGNIDKIFQGQIETQLTKVGIKQAADVGQHFKENKRRFDKVYSSPQLRAQHTAEIICSHIHHPLETSDLLKEINNGNLAGLRGEEIDTMYPQREDRTNPFLPVGDHGESWFELYLRGMNILDLVMSNPPGNYLVVSHGAILTAVLWSIFGIPPQPGRRSTYIRFENTGICEVSYTPGENLWRFHSLNMLVHQPN